MDLSNRRTLPIIIAAAARKEEKSPHLPEDLIHIILTRLPAKSALRFRSVSKLWNTLITNPRFTRHHQIISQRRNPTTFLAAFPVGSKPFCTLVWITIDRHVESIRVDREAYYRSSIREFTCAPDIVGDACSGVFCVVSGLRAAFWNPATREVRVVSLDLDLDSVRVRYAGLGCLKDEKSNVVDFKLLFMVISYAKGDSVGDFVVYSLRTNKCSSVEGPSFPLIGILRAGSVYLNGFLYWLAKGGEGDKAAYILTFNLVSETFGQIDSPHTDGINIHDRNSNFLTVIDNQYLSFGMVDRESECLDFWVMREIDGWRSWIRRERVGPLMNTGLMLRYSDCIGGVITQADLDGRFGYHVRGNASKHETGLYGLTNWFEYSESLVSLKRIANWQ